jgi:hypothetical protein
MPGGRRTPPFAFDHGNLDVIGPLRTVEFGSCYLAAFPIAAAQELLCEIPNKLLAMRTWLPLGF